MLVETMKVNEEKSKRKENGEERVVRVACRLTSQAKGVG